MLYYDLAEEISKHDDTEDDAIDAKDAEGVALDEIHKQFDCQNRDEE